MSARKKGKLKKKTGKTRKKRKRELQRNDKKGLKMRN